MPQWEHNKPWLNLLFAMIQRVSFSFIFPPFHFSSMAMDMRRCCIPRFNRKYIDSFRVHFPATAMFFLGEHLPKGCLTWFRYRVSPFTIPLGFRMGGINHQDPCAKMCVFRSLFVTKNRAIQPLHRIEDVHPSPAWRSTLDMSVEGWSQGGDGDGKGIARNWHCNPLKTNMTGWKIHHLKMYFLLNKGIFPMSC